MSSVLVATSSGLFKLTAAGSGGGWQRDILVTPKEPIMALAADDTGAHCHLGLYRGGVIGSIDGGRNWQDHGSGLPLKDVRALARHPQDPRVLYAGTEPSALFVSENGGGTWRELAGIRQHPRASEWRFPVPPGRAHVRTISFDPRDPQVLYVGIEVGALLKSVDGGQTWQDLEGCGHDIHRVMIHPSAPDTVLVTTGLDTKPYQRTGRKGLFRSEDAGRTWSEANQGLGGRTYCEDAIGFDPSDPSRVYMTTANGIPPHWASPIELGLGVLKGGFVYFVRPSRWRRRTGAEVVFNRSDDGGRTWRQIGAGLPTPLFDMVWALDVGANGSVPAPIFIGTTAGAVYASEDRGESWRKIAADLPPISHVRALR